MLFYIYFWNISQMLCCVGYLVCGSHMTVKQAEHVLTVDFLNGMHNSAELIVRMVQGGNIENDVFYPYALNPCDAKSTSSVLSQKNLTII